LSSTRIISLSHSARATGFPSSRDGDVVVFRESNVVVIAKATPSSYAKETPSSSRRRPGSIFLRHVMTRHRKLDSGLRRNDALSLRRNDAAESAPE
jgi:hypothetical protein